MLIKVLRPRERRSIQVFFSERHVSLLALGIFVDGLVGTETCVSEAHPLVGITPLLLEREKGDDGPLVAIINILFNNGGTGALFQNAWATSIETTAASDLHWSPDSGLILRD